MRKYNRRPRRRPRPVAFLILAVFFGVLVYFMINALGADDFADGYGGPWFRHFDREPGADIALLRTDFNSGAMVYIFYYDNMYFDISRHHIIDPDNLVNLVTLNRRESRLSIITRVPVVFRAEQHGDDIHLVAINPRNIYERIVIIDPGHGGSDTGAVVGDIRESDIVLAISMQIYDIFAQSDSGIKAFLTRNDDTFVFNALRSNIANTMGDMLVSVHTNAYPHSQAVAGTEVLFHPAGLLPANGAAGRFYLSNREFSQIMQDGLVAELGTRDRGIIERTDLLLLNTSQVPTAFLEIDFKTNPAALANLSNAEYQQRIAQAVYEGIVRGFNTAVRVE